MRIAVFHELPVGGARSAVNEIAGRLKINHEVDLYYVDEKRDIHEETNYNKAYFYSFISKKWRGKNWKVRLYKDTLELYKLYKLHKKISEDIRSERYDILFINASKYIESPFILRFPNTVKIFYLHDPHDRSLYESNLISKKPQGIFRRLYENIISFFKKQIDKTNLNGADVFFANSKFTQKLFKQTYNKKSEVAYLGVDSRFFTSNNTKKEYDILYIGSREPVDRYLLFNKSLLLLKFKPKIKTVFFEDRWLNREAIRDLYRKSEIIVCLGKNEPFGLIPLEAMSCGVPVIALNEGGYKETVVDNKTGYLIPGDPHILAEKIEYLLKNEKIRQQMGKNGREQILKDWTWEKSIKEIEKILISLK